LAASFISVADRITAPAKQRGPLRAVRSAGHQTCHDEPAAWAGGRGPGERPTAGCKVRITSGTGPTAQGRRCYIAVMAQMLNQKTEGHADLLLKIERRRRLAKQVPDIKTAQQLLELATEYLKQLIKAKNSLL